MEALAGLHLAPRTEQARHRFVWAPKLSLSWVRLEIVLLTGALIMAG